MVFNIVAVVVFFVVSLYIAAVQVTSYGRTIRSRLELFRVVLVGVVAVFVWFILKTVFIEPDSRFLATMIVYVFALSANSILRDHLFVYFKD